jgi:hypothetical protein
VYRVSCFAMCLSSSILFLSLELRSQLRVFENMLLMFNQGLSMQCNDGQFKRKNPSKIREREKEKRIEKSSSSIARITELQLNIEWLLHILCVAKRDSMTILFVRSFSIG